MDQTALLYGKPFSVSAMDKLLETETVSEFKTNLWVWYEVMMTVSS